MIVSHRHKFIFIKSKKTAGTSIEIALSRFCGDEDIVTPIVPETKEELEKMGFKGAQNYKLSPFQFTVDDWRKRLRGERPAFRDHVPAAYIKKVLGGRIWNRYFKFSIERNPYDKAVSRYYWSTRKMEPRPTLEDHLNARAPAALSNWHLYTIDDELAVDYMMRYESLEESLRYVEEALALPSPLQLPTAKSGYRKSRRHYSQLISPEARKRIDTVCAKELAAFRYEWEEA